MMSFILILISLIVVIVLISSIFSKKNVEPLTACIDNCVYVHKQKGLNYPWLNHINGGLLKIQYMEPPTSGTWLDYTDITWNAHCNVISHKPDELVAAHIQAFIDPNTRFAKLKFFFKNGLQAELDEEHAREYYNLEAEYFKKNNICVT